VGGSLTPAEQLDFSRLPPEAVEELLNCCAEQMRRGPVFFLPHPPKNENRPDDFLAQRTLAWLPHLTISAP
jgi:hypothetical protein